jgi:hypothetical protein
MCPRWEITALKSASAHDFDDNIQNKTEIQHTIGAIPWSSTVQHDIIVRLIDPTKPTRFEVTRGQQSVAIQVPPLKSTTPPPVSLADAAYHGEPVNIVLERNIGTLMAGYVRLIPLSQVARYLV